MYLCRYRTIRTRVGRFLKKDPQSGSGRDDVSISPEFTNLAWLFPYIKSRVTVSSGRHQQRIDPISDASGESYNNYANSNGG